MEAITSNFSVSIIHVHTADGSFKNVRVDAGTTVQKILEVVLTGMGLQPLAFGHFTLRFKFSTPTSDAKAQAACCSKDVCDSSASSWHWLHRELTISEVYRLYTPAEEEKSADLQPVPRFELRVRFIRGDMEELCRTEISTFLYLYEQLWADYTAHVAWKISSHKALEIAALGLRKRFADLSGEALERKIVGHLERPGQLNRCLPKSITLETKKKHLIKNVAAAVRNISSLTELECVFEFMRVLGSIIPFDTEVFRGSVGIGWNHPANIHVSHELGVAITSEASNQPTSLTSLANITKIVLHPYALCLTEGVWPMKLRDERKNSSATVVNLEVSAKNAHLRFTFPTLEMAESFAQLVDGHKRLLSGSYPACIIWRKPPMKLEAETCSHSDEENEWQGLEAGRGEASQNCQTDSPLSDMVTGSTSAPDFLQTTRAKRMVSGNNSSGVHSFESTYGNCDMDEHATSTLPNVDRAVVQLKELIGDGEFGCVYKGYYTVEEGKPRITVAVKVCKQLDDSADLVAANKHLLEEAHTMSRFRHPHIVQCLGICSTSQSTTSNMGMPAPIWVLMEFARLGQLRHYLQREKESIHLPTQILFASQLASALGHLHERYFLHRDVAARNCLVMDKGCVKLADFGFSRRMLADDDVYTASRGRVLPIKWLPPESISHKMFGTYSDVYMLGVTMWEILMYGVKPWQGYRNHEVAVRMERSEILYQPPNCPNILYALMRAMWRMNEAERITALEAHECLEELLEQLRRGIPAAQLRLCRVLSKSSSPSPPAINYSSGGGGGENLAKRSICADDEGVCETQSTSFSSSVTPGTGEEK